MRAIACTFLTKEKWGRECGPTASEGARDPGRPESRSVRPCLVEPEINVSTWLQRLSPRPDGLARLFCIPHAGGSAALYRCWPQRLPEFDVCAVQLPGRANRFGEPALTRVDAIVDYLLPEILPLLDRPYAFFGHSMGTALALAVMRRLQVIGVPLPSHLFVSARQPPHKPFPERTLTGLTDAEVVAEIHREFGGFPPEVLACPELVEMLLPTLRCDFEALEHHAPVLESRLPVPITALGGTTDLCSTPERLQAWQAYTTSALDIRLFPGDHFYLDNCLESVTRTVRDVLLAQCSSRRLPLDRAA